MQKKKKNILDSNFVVNSNNYGEISIFYETMVSCNDKNISNYGYIGSSILHIYQKIFWYKISIDLKLN